MATATRKSSLRAVRADEKRAAPKTILEAAEAGVRLEELRAMRRRIARAMDDPNTPARDLAALSRRQLEIGREIEAVVVAEDEDHSVVVNADDEVWDGTGY
jgi:hypothetical protein